MKQKIRRDIIPGDDDTRVYHSRIVLTEKAHEHAHGNQKHSNGILRMLVEIPGVHMAVVQKYIAIVYKAKMFTWEEVEPAVVRVMGALNEPLPDIAALEHDKFYWVNEKGGIILGPYNSADDALPFRPEYNPKLAKGKRRE